MKILGGFVKFENPQENNEKFQSFQEKNYKFDCFREENKTRKK